MAIQVLNEDNVEKAKKRSPGLAISLMKEQGGAANGRNVSLLMKSVDELTPEQVELVKSLVGEEYEIIKGQIKEDKPPTEIVKEADNEDGDAVLNNDTSIVKNKEPDMSEEIEKAVAPIKEELAKAKADMEVILKERDAATAKLEELEKAAAEKKAAERKEAIVKAVAEEDVDNLVKATAELNDEAFAAVMSTIAKAHKGQEEDAMFVRKSTDASTEEHKESSLAERMRAKYAAASK